MSEPKGAGATSERKDTTSGVPPLVDQLANVATHWVTVQSDLAKKCLQRWPGVNAWGSPVAGEDLWVAWIDTLGDMAQAWFTWVQIFDVMAGSGWAQGTSTSGKTGVSSEAFTIPGTDAADIALPRLEHVDGKPIITTGISLSPTHITAGARDVTVSVTLPPGAPTGRYFGMIVDAHSGADIMQIDLVVGAES